MSASMSHGSSAEPNLTPILDMVFQLITFFMLVISFKTAAIDTGACPLYLLTGEYDFSCTPQDTERTAAKIKGARVTVMREIGHFPMSENPAQFRRYILPVLEEIRARA